MVSLQTRKSYTQNNISQSYFYSSSYDEITSILSSNISGCNQSDESKVRISIGFQIIKS